MAPLSATIASRIRQHGPLTVAEFMELALYHPELGYYSRAERRSGRSGDFFTSVDVGPLFGETVAFALVEMWEVLRGLGAATFDLVEVGAGNGRLARDILDAAARDRPDFYRTLRLTLVERSPAARAAQRAMLAPHAGRIAGLRDDLPQSVTGVIYANELLDALPVHVVTRTGGTLREIVVTERGGILQESDADLSADVAAHLAANPIDVAEGDRVEVGVAAACWMRDAAAALDRGFLLLFDYGREARHLRSPAGTLTTYRAHTADAVRWLEAPGECDLTSHVDLTAMRRAAEEAGLAMLGAIDQTYFLLSLGLVDRLPAGHDRLAIRQRLAARTLIAPEGLGSTMKAIVFAKGVGATRLAALASGRLT